MSNRPAAEIASDLAALFNELAAQGLTAFTTAYDGQGATFTGIKPVAGGPVVAALHRRTSPPESPGGPVVHTWEHRT